MRNFLRTLRAAPRIMWANAKANPTLAAVAMVIDLSIAALVVVAILSYCGGCN